MKLIVLTDYFTKKPVHVNADKIALAQISPSDEGTIVFLEGIVEPVQVEENPEEIAQHANG